MAQLLKIGEEGGVWANMIADAVIAEQSVKNPIGLAEEPKMVVQLSSSDDLAEKEKAMQLRDRLTWPGNTPWRVAQVDLKPLTT